MAATHTRMENIVVNESKLGLLMLSRPKGDRYFRA